MAKMFRSSMRLYLHSIQGGKCHYCSRQMTREADNGPYYVTEDHVVAKSQGGGDSLGNLVGACWTCNNMRGKIPYFYFKQFIAKHGNERRIPEVLKGLTREEYDKHKLMYDAVRTGYYHLDVPSVVQSRKVEPPGIVPPPPPPSPPVEPLYRRTFLHQTRRKMQSILIGIPMRKRLEILKEEQ